jgi:ATPase subunit of ABC transporter with duplicated ATPase domains
MLSVNRISKSYNLATILNNISFSIGPGDRAGLVGPNGSGKTTLLRILAGQEEADTGHYSVTPGYTRIAYLPQGFEFDPSTTIGEILNEQIGDPTLLQADLARIAAIIALEPDRTEAIDAYDTVLQRLNRLELGSIQSTL